MPGLVNGHMHGHGALAKGLFKDHWTLELFLNSSPSIGGNRTLETSTSAACSTPSRWSARARTACYDLFFEFPVPSVEGVSELGRGYREVGVRATIAPMIADMTLYQALPGLMEAIPDEHRAGRRPLPARASRRRRSRPAERCSSLAVRPRRHPPRHRADHPASLQRRVPHRLPRPRARVRPAAADPSGRIEEPGRAGPAQIRQDADRPSRCSSA